jgi:hypothetical protein
MFAKFYAFIIAWLGTGIFFAIPFVIAGAHRLTRDRASVSVATRLLLLPGAMIFWPYLLWRWLASRKLGKAK